MMWAVAASVGGFFLTVAVVWAAGCLIGRWRNPRLRRLLASLTRGGVPLHTGRPWVAIRVWRWLSTVVDWWLRLAGVRPGETPPGLRTRRGRLAVAGSLMGLALLTGGLTWRMGVDAALSPALLAIASVVAGWLVLRLGAWAWIWWQARRWTRHIDASLSDVLDLWVLCLGAGMSFQSALVRVAEDAFLVGRAVREELWLTYQELSAGCPREEALRHFARRCGNLPDLNTLISQIIHAERLGGSLAQTLKVYATTLRLKRYQAAREQIYSVPVRLAFPLVFCILPALFVVILGPSLLRLFSTLSVR